MPEKKQFKVIADSLRVRKTPNLQGEVIDSLKKDDIVEFIQISDDSSWLYIKKATLEGWSYYKYLTPYHEVAENEKYSEIFDIVNTSAISKYYWKDRGRPAIGYYKGMALVFARMYCKLKSGDQIAIEMAKANTDNLKKDALAYYADKFNDSGMSNEADGADTLRHLFVLMIGLGMRESSGRYCEGRDMAAHNTTAETAEAGLFQTSYNAISASPLLKTVFDKYKINPDGFEEIFKKGGVTCSASSWENYGAGEGAEFQQLSKKCPAFAAEFAGVALRHICTHWGPINNKHVELRPECDLMLLKVQHVIDMNNLCPF